MREADCDRCGDDHMARCCTVKGAVAKSGFSAAGYRGVHSSRISLVFLKID